MTNRESLSRLLSRGISRRKLVHGSMAAGAVLGSGLWTPARADDDEQAGTRLCGQPLPITHTQPNPFGVPTHVYFPGPIDGSAFPLTDPLGTHPEGRDPSTITNFSGFVGQVDLVFSGTGTDTATGATAAYSFHTDTRFIKGEFIGADEKKHRGAFAFI
jgi:hypothetical protein